MIVIVVCDYEVVVIVVHGWWSFLVLVMILGRGREVVIHGLWAGWSQSLDSWNVSGLKSS